MLPQVKEFPGYNFTGLIFGPGGDNRKRLEKVEDLFSTSLPANTCELSASLVWLFISL